MKTHYDEYSLRSAAIVILNINKFARDYFKSADELVDWMKHETETHHPEAQYWMCWGFCISLWTNSETDQREAFATISPHIVGEAIGLTKDENGDLIETAP